MFITYIDKSHKSWDQPIINDSVKSFKPEISNMASETSKIEKSVKVIAPSDVKIPLGNAALKCGLTCDENLHLIKKISRWVYEFFVKLFAPTTKVIKTTREMATTKNILQNLKNSFKDLHPVVQKEAAKAYIGCRIEAILKESPKNFPELVKKVGEDLKANFIGEENLEGVLSFEFLAEAITGSLTSEGRGEKMNPALVARNAFAYAKKIQEGKFDSQGFDLYYVPEDMVIDAFDSWETEAIDAYQLDLRLEAMMTALTYFDKGKKARKKALDQFNPVYRKFLLNSKTKVAAEKKLQQTMGKLSQQMQEDLKKETLKNELILKKSADEILAYYHASTNEVPLRISKALDELKQEQGLPKHVKKMVQAACEGIENQLASNIANKEDLMEKLLETSNMQEFINGPVMFFVSSLPKGERKKIERQIKIIQKNIPFYQENQQKIREILENPNPADAVEGLSKLYDGSELRKLRSFFCFDYYLNNKADVLEIILGIEFELVKFNALSFNGMNYKARDVFRDGETVMQNTIGYVTRYVESDPLTVFKKDMKRSPKVLINGHLYYWPDWESIYDHLQAKLGSKADFIAASICQSALVETCAPLGGFLSQYETQNVSLLPSGQELMEYAVEFKEDRVFITSKVCFGVMIYSNSTKVTAGYVPVIRKFSVPIDQIPTEAQMKSFKIKNADASIEYGRVYPTLVDAMKAVQPGAISQQQIKALIQKFSDDQENISNMVEFLNTYVIEMALSGLIGIDFVVEILPELKKKPVLCQEVVKTFLDTLKENEDRKEAKALIQAIAPLMQV